MNQDELRILMECYRADPQGVGDAEFAALHEAAAADPSVREQLEAVQAWDSAISVAMHDVPVPAGLADRLLEAVEQAQQEPDSEVRVTPAEQRIRWWNRWPARVAAATVSVAALAMIVCYVIVVSDTLTGAQVAQSAQGWIVGLDQEAWQRSEPPAGWFDVQQWLNFPDDAWQRCNVLDSEAVVVHTIVPPARSQAWLFVIKTSEGRLLLNRPPNNPNSTTGGICVGVWKDGDYLYVLAVEGTRATYRRLLKTRAVACVGNGRSVDRG